MSRGTSRGALLFFGFVLVAGCATGSSVDEEPPATDDSGSSDGVLDAKADGHKLGDATGAHDVGADTTTSNTGDDDSSTGQDSTTGDDTGTGQDSTTGDDTGPGDDGGVDANV